jgi:hypothetical protein
MRSHLYRYVFADIATGRTVDTLPLSKVRWDKRISSGDGTQPGTMEAKLTVTDGLAARVMRVLGRDQSPHALHIWRDGSLAWSGIVSSKSSGLDGDTESLDIAGVTWEGYLARRLLRADKTTTQPARTALNTLWAEVQAASGGNVRVSAGPTGGTVLARTWLNGSSTWYSDMAEDIAADGGLEWVVDYSRSTTTGLYSGVLRYGTPTIGQTDTTHSFVFATGQPGNSITGWTFQQSLDDGGTAAQAIGGQDPDLSSNVAAVVPPAMSVIVEDPVLATGGWLRTDVETQLTDERDQTTLDAAAARLLAGTGRWGERPEVTVDLDKSTFQPQSIGDYARFVIRSSVIDIDWRARTIGLNVEVRDDGTENTTLLFEGDN